MPASESQPTGTYLGDGLYVTHTPWELELYAHNGIEKTNRVFLDPTALQRFVTYLKEHKIDPGNMFARQPERTNE